MPCKGIQASFGSLAVGSGFQALYSRVLVSGTWIPDSLSSIPDSKAQDFGFHEQKNSRILESGSP